MRKHKIFDLARRLVPVIFLIASLVIGWHPSPASAKTEKGKTIKYVLFFIGDGMGMPQRTAAEQYLQEQQGNPEATLLMNRFPAQGVTTTHANDRFITGSAASATALACGVK
ncbi:MAG: alkaline phosphatase, partial [Thermodesulfobacteriota bacterium]